MFILDNMFLINETQCTTRFFANYIACFEDHKMNAKSHFQARTKYFVVLENLK